MSDEVEHYIAQATRGLIPSDRVRVAHELRTDLIQLINELRLAGHDEHDSVRRALKLFGHAAPVSVSMTLVHTLPRLRTLGAICCFLAAGWAMLSTTRMAMSFGVQPYGCITSSRGACLPDYSGWVALDDISLAAAKEGWQVTPQTIVADDMPNVANDVLQIQSQNFTVEIPSGPNYILAARMARRGLPLRPDPEVKEIDGRVFIHSSALFQRFAKAQATSVRLTRQPQKSVIELGDARLEFPYRQIDPAGQFLWVEVGYSLGKEYGLTVAAESRSWDTPQHAVSVQVPRAGTYVFVYRHPSAPGVGYLITQADDRGQIRTTLPIQVRNTAVNPVKAWWQPQTVSVLRVTENVTTGPLLRPVPWTLNPG